MYRYILVYTMFDRPIIYTMFLSLLTAVHDVSFMGMYVCIDKP